MIVLFGAPKIWKRKKRGEIPTEIHSFLVCVPYFHVFLQDRVPPSLTPGCVPLVEAQFSVFSSFFRLSSRVWSAYTSFGAVSAILSRCCSDRRDSLEDPRTFFSYFQAQSSQEFPGQLPGSVFRLLRRLRPTIKEAFTSTIHAFSIRNCWGSFWKTKSFIDSAVYVAHSAHLLWLQRVWPCDCCEINEKKDSYLTIARFYYENVHCLCLFTVGEVTVKDGANGKRYLNISGSRKIFDSFLFF